jgi:hypothetical protein
VNTKSVAMLLVLAFAIFETFMGFDYAVFVETDNNLLGSGPGLGQLQTSINGPPNLIQLIFWSNSIPLAASSWAIFGVTFYRQGISRKWKSQGFDRDVFRLMVTMRGASARLRLLNFVQKPKHKSELSRLTGLDWKEVDREIVLLERFGLISLHAQSGSVKMYKLSEQGKTLLMLMLELKAKPMNIAREQSPESS